MRWTKNDLVAMVGTLAIGAFGGVIAKVLGLPLPWLIGSQIALCIAALTRFQIAGSDLKWPVGTRLVFLPVIGVVIGGSFTPEIIARLPGWWPLVVLVSVFLLIIHAVVFLIFRRLGRMDLPTAFFASFPGGFIEAAELGRAAGGDERMITLQHFLRISLIVFMLPLIFFLIIGSRVGSSAGATIGAAGDLSLASAALLALAGLTGTLGARLIHMPAPDIAGAVLVSAGFHLMGWIEGGVPFWLIEITQLVVGTSLGVGFVGLTLRQLGHSLAMALLAFAVVFGLGAMAAWLFARHLGFEIPELILSLAPGGLAEMSLIAVSLGLSVPVVTLAHLYRICFTVLVLPAIFRHFVSPHTQPGD